MPPKAGQGNGSEEMSRRRFSLPDGFRLDTAVFLLLVFSYLWRIVDPRLIHHGLGILSYYYPFSFHTGRGFLQQHVARPGGLVEYALRFLTQGYALGWPGALVITVVVWHLTWTTDALGRWAGRPGGRLLRFVPGVLLIAMHGSYSHPLGSLLSLQAGLIAFALYVRWAPHSGGKRLVSLLLASAILYHMAGSGSVVFPVLVATYELLVARRPTLAAAAIGLGLAVPWGSAALFAVDVREAYGGFLVSDPGMLPGQLPLTLALVAFFPAVLAASRLGVGRGASPVAGNRSHPSRQSKFPPPIPPHHERRFAAVPVALVLLGGGLAAWFSLDALARTVLEIDDHSQAERWPDVLAAADRLPAGFYDVRCHRNVMLALYHTQRLGDEMFRYPQRPGVDLFSTPGEASDLGSQYQESRLFLELGHVNQAEKCACEALETCGDLPAVLEQLAVINVVKDRPETARIFYHALARQPLYRRTARQRLDRLATDPQLDGDLRVARLRRNMVAKDYVALDTSVEQFLQMLWERNPHNRMAFELLMAHYLAVGRPDGVAAWLPKLKDFSYPGIPRLYQEAAIIHARTSGIRPVIPGYELDAAVLARADQFARLTAAARNREGAIQSALAAGFGDSYFFYWAFGFSGR
jgi:hypothetical protein